MKSYSINNEAIIECLEVTTAEIYQFFSKLLTLKSRLLSLKLIAKEIPPLAFRDSKLILPKDPLILSLLEDSEVQKILPPAIKNNASFLKELTHTICDNAPVTPHPLPEPTVMEQKSFAFKTKTRAPVDEDKSAATTSMHDNQMWVIVRRFPDGLWGTEEAQRRLSNIVKIENKSENGDKAELDEKNPGRTDVDLVNLTSRDGILTNVTDELIGRLCNKENTTYEARKDIFLTLTRQIFPPELKCKKLTFLRHYFNENEGMKELKQCIPLAESFRQPIVSITEKIRKNSDLFSSDFFATLIHFYTLYSDSAKSKQYYSDRRKEFKSESKNEKNSLVEFLFDPLPEPHLVQLAYRTTVKTFQKKQQPNQAIDNLQQDEKPNQAINNLQQDIDSIEPAKHFCENIAAFAAQVANIGGPKARFTLNYLISILKSYSPATAQETIRNLTEAAVKHRHKAVVDFLIPLSLQHDVSQRNDKVVKDCFNEAARNLDMPLVKLFFKRMKNSHLMPLPYEDHFAIGNPSLLDFLFSQNKISTAIIDEAFYNAVNYNHMYAARYLKQKGAAWISLRLEAGKLTYNNALDSAALGFGKSELDDTEFEIVRWVAEHSGIHPEENVRNKPHSTAFHELLRLLAGEAYALDCGVKRRLNIIWYLLAKVKGESPPERYEKLIGDLKHFAGKKSLAFKNLPDQEEKYCVSRITVFNKPSQTAGDSKIRSFDRIESAPSCRLSNT